MAEGEEKYSAKSWPVENARKNEFDRASNKERQKRSFTCIFLLLCEHYYPREEEKIILLRVFDYCVFSIKPNGDYIIMIISGL